MNYTERWNLSSIPDDALYSEVGRRRSAKRTEPGGRKPVLKPCAWCGQQFGAREMRRHRPLCASKPAAKTIAKSNGSPKPSARAKTTATPGA